MNKFDDIENKSIWDLYVENFRDGLFDLCPSIDFWSSPEPDTSEETGPEPVEENE